MPWAKISPSSPKILYILSPTPADVPPDKITISASSNPLRIILLISFSSSLAIPKGIGSPPFSIIPAQIVYVFTSYIFPNSNFSPGLFNSFPVEITAIFGFIITLTLSNPAEAKTPISLAVSLVPFLTKSSPALISEPADIIFAPGGTGL